MTSDKKASIHVNETSPTFGSSITVTFDLGAHALEDCGITLTVKQDGQEVMAVGGSPITATHVGGTPYPFVLGPTAKWTGGAAEGRVELYDSTPHKKVIASQDFAIGA